MLYSKEESRGYIPRGLTATRKCSSLKELFTSPIRPLKQQKLHGQLLPRLADVTTKKHVTTMLMHLRPPQQVPESQPIPFHLQLFEFDHDCFITFDSKYVEDRGHNNFILQLSMQTLLQQACNVLGVGNPTYTRQDVMLHNGQAYYRFYASQNTDLISHSPVSMGQYTPTENMAPEDVALLLLRRLTQAFNATFVISIFIPFHYTRVKSQDWRPQISISSWRMRH